MIGLFFYRLGILGYGVLVRFVSLWHIKARLWVRGRRNWYNTLSQSFVPTKGKVIWFHCASLGEFEQGRAVMELFKQRHPDWQLVVTFYSPSGYEVRKNYAVADWVCYLPLDTPRNARRFVEAIRPSVAVFVKYEFWYYYLRELHRQNISVYLISAIFRREQAFFKSYGSMYRKWLLLFTGLMVQDRASVDLLAEYGITRGVQLVGDSRFDRVWQAAMGQMRSLETIEQFCAGTSIFVAGSTWMPDEERLRSVIDILPAGWKFILVPHEIHEANIQVWMSRYAGQVVRYTKEYTSEELHAARLLVVDQVGLLLSIYRYAAIAYIGGGFGVGIHNTLEPASCGLPVLFGPNFKAFREARELLARGAALTLQTAEDFKHELLALMADSSRREEMGRLAKEYVATNIGASTKIIETIERNCLEE